MHCMTSLWGLELQACSVRGQGAGSAQLLDRLVDWLVKGPDMSVVTTMCKAGSYAGSCDPGTTLESCMTQGLGSRGFFRSTLAGEVLMPDNPCYALAEVVVMHMSVGPVVHQCLLAHR